MISVLEFVAVVFRLHGEPTLTFGEVLGFLGKPEAITPTLVGEVALAYAFADLHDLYGLAFESYLAHHDDEDQENWWLVVNALFNSANQMA